RQHRHDQVRACSAKPDTSKQISNLRHEYTNGAVGIVDNVAANSLRIGLWPINTARQVTDGSARSPGKQKRRPYLVLRKLNQKAAVDYDKQAVAEEKDKNG